MNKNQFLVFANALINSILEGWEKKNAEYGSDDNVFQHFEDSVGFDSDGATRERMLWDNMRKHVMSVCRNASTVDGLGEAQLRYAVKEKIGDNITYLLLLAAMFKERADALQGNSSTTGVGGGVPEVDGPSTVSEGGFNSTVVS